MYVITEFQKMENFQSLQIIEVIQQIYRSNSIKELL